MRKIKEIWICPNCKTTYEKGDTYVIKDNYASCDKCLEPLHIQVIKTKMTSETN